ncbi:GUN4 domain-containing protein [Mastigocoleus testarum]|uniref:TIR domain-containing protein n=1 Tax=Mastigocoleus testarum BC008 TaxID=371196 RepID=A0A0V7ZRM9_9CYAN|nr:GUN4 domain-containing protein [Mastigocoleus testarum]KST67301.1 hypothetical protein BC008_29375 [Mastigocoleus testarum BC008]
MKQPQIFLAHASEDKPEVEKIYKRLERKGYKPWMDKKDLLPGQNWQVEIPNAIKQSQIFIACFSHVSVNKEGYIQQELRLALNQYTQMPPGRIFLIPLKLDDCEIPNLQLPEQGVNLRDLNWQDYRDKGAFENLVRSIESERSKTTLSPTASSSSGGKSPTNTPSFNNRWFASIWGVVILLLVGVPTGIVLRNQYPPKGTRISSTKTPTQTPEQPTQRKTASPTATPEPPTPRKTASPNPTPEAPPAESLNADYSKLENLLKQGNWKEADEETFKVMLKVTKREREGSFDKESIGNFPCPDLKKIDELWVKYSNGKFGFSVQKSIVQKKGFNLNDTKDYESFLVIIGWYDDYVKFTPYEQTALNGSRTGQLPQRVAINSGKFKWFSSLVPRTVACNI